MNAIVIEAATALGCPISTSRPTTPVTATLATVGDADDAARDDPYPHYQHTVRDDPYPFYQRLRAEDPVHWDEPRQMWLVTRYADVLAGLRDPRLSAQRSWDPIAVPRQARETVRAVQQAYARQLLLRDGRDHARLRRVMAAAFTPRIVEGLRPLIQRRVDELLDAVAAQGRMDVIADLAYPLPANVIAALLGLPERDLGRLQVWSRAMGTTFAHDLNRPLHLVRAYRGVAEFMAYVADLVAQRRRAPRNDLIQTLLTASSEEHTLAAEDIVANCALLLFTGHETTTNLIGNGLLALLRHPAQMHRWRDDPALIGRAVEELLRFDSPVQTTGRVAREELEIGGRRIGAGQYVGLSLGAANRDPAQFDAPERLDLGREENRHLAFAYGPHFCLGAALARLEGQIALGTLLRRWPHLRLAAETLRWRDNPVLRGLESLPICLGDPPGRSYPPASRPILSTRLSIPYGHAARRSTAASGCEEMT